eukprot:COSAG02_NODE_3358_length_6873_cov_18.182315_1_plen_38_part_00
MASTPSGAEMLPGLGEALASVRRRERAVTAALPGRSR